MAWPGQCLWICFLQLHQVCIEVLPHPREDGWYLKAVLRECLHAFHHYQLHDRLASIGSRHHDGLPCLTSAVCHVYGANSTRHHRHYQWWRNQKWRCPTTIEGIHGWCNRTRPVQSGCTGATGPLPRPLHMGTDEGQAKEEPKYFPCQWHHPWHPFLHRWQHHPHTAHPHPPIPTPGEGAEARKLSWSSLMTMEPLALSFLLRSTYNLLPTPANHKQWGSTGDDTCMTCKSARGTLRHVLSSCESSLQMYTGRHNRVLATLAELTETQCRVANEQPTQDPNPCISFLQELEAPPWQVSKPQGQRFLARNRKMAADLKEDLHIPHHIVHTQDWPNIVIWSATARHHCWADCTLRTWKKPSRGRNSGMRICAYYVKTKDGLVKWCPLRLVVVASSVEQQSHTWPCLD